VPPVDDELQRRLAALDPAARARVDRLFEISIEHGETDPPASMTEWLRATFGSVEAVRNQTIVKVTNRATLEAAIIAPLRARRPQDGGSPARVLDAAIAETIGDPFCTPETSTPANAFGRVRGAHMVSGANAAIADRHHGVLVFETHDPLAFDPAMVADLFTTGRAWAELARASDPDAVNYLLIWNCLWRAGGSIIHGHAQALLGAGLHYAAVERFRRDAAAYRAAIGANLADDLVATHRDLGLTIDEPGATIVAHLTPIKEHEMLVVGEAGADEREPAFVDAVARALIGLRDRIGVRAFNLALWRAPLDAADGWEGIPPIVRIVDRGDPFSRPSDIGAMELYGTPIVAADPYTLIAAIR
jgi:hypothetical protein